MSPTDGEGGIAPVPLSFQQRPEPSPELAAIYTRVESGITWLTERDPDGAFHVWFTSRIGPRAPMPAQSEARRAAYAEYHEARVLFERLWKKMVALEEREAAGG